MPALLRDQPRGLIRWIAGALVLVVLVGCRDDPPATVPAEIAFRRISAFRQACAAGNLVQRAEEDLDLLEDSAEMMELLGGDLADFNRMATEAALHFARAYHRHAELRATAYAHLDSAINRSTSSADSLRHMERAGTIAILTPDPGTVEANVIDAYDTNIAALLEDEDHPCNWDFPF